MVSEEISREERRKLKKARKKEAKEAEKAAEMQQKGGGSKKKRSREEAAAQELEEGEIGAPRSKKDKSNGITSGKKQTGSDGGQQRADGGGKEAFLSLLKGSASKPQPSRFEGVTWRTPFPRPAQRVSDVRQLILSTLGVRGEEMSITWEIPRLSEVTRVAVVVVDGMGNSTVKEHRRDVPFVASLEQHCAILRSPGSKIEVFPLMGELLTCPAKTSGTPEAKHKGNKKQRTPISKGPVEDAAQVMAAGEICLTQEELSENGFPGYADRQDGSSSDDDDERAMSDGEGADRHVVGGVTCPVIGDPVVPEGYVCSENGRKKKKKKEQEQACGDDDDDDGGQGGDRLLAMDCEMVTTKDGLELARVTVIDASKNVLLDELVMPDNPILDYNTKYSGITEEMLKEVDTSLADVQKRLLKLVKPSDILIGHSLENDFKACKFVHKRVIDTSVLYPHQKGGPYKNALRYLVSKFLGREMDRKDGHCSADDAQAVMDLVILKLQKGAAFGSGTADTKIEGESLFRLLSRQEPPIPSTMVGNATTLSRFASGGVNCVTCTTSKDLSSKMSKACNDARRGLVLGVVDSLSGGDNAQSRAETDECIKAVGDSLPGGTLFVVLGSNEDLGSVSSLRQRRRASQTGKSAGMPWTDDDEQTLCQEVLRARNGVCLVTVVR